MPIEGPDNQISICHFGRESEAVDVRGVGQPTPRRSPDGLRVVYYSNRSGPLNLHWQPADGSGAVERLTNSPNAHPAMSWSPSGLLAYTDSLGGDRESRSWTSPGKSIFLKTSFRKGGRSFLQKEIGCVCLRRIRGAEVYVQSYPGPGGKQLVSSAAAPNRCGIAMGASSYIEARTG